jgi:glycosyltransferase involved in cell wall biosynthesis
MNKPTLGIYTFAHNLVEYDYPFLESLRSALPIADQIVVAECESTDNTLELLKQFQEENKDKVKIVYQPWVKHFTELSKLGNYASTFLETDWKWELQADEVLHENQYINIETWLGMIQKHNMNVSALTTKYTHFVASYFATFPFCYSEINRIHKRGSNWKLVGDACQLDGGNPKEILSTDIMVYHYGKVHNGYSGFKKEIDFQMLFKDIGFPDPKMKQMQEKLGEDYCDYLYLFENHVKEGNIKQFEGTHPSVMTERIAKFKDEGYEQLISRMKEELKIL